MTQSLVESAIELTLVLVQRGNVSPEDLQDTLQKTYATLAALKAQEVSGTSISVPIADLSPVDWRKSITRQTIICLECGQLWRQLTRSHLMAHRLDVRSYRAKYGIPQTQPLQLHLATDRHRQAARETWPWEKTPNFIKGHARHGQPSLESDVEALHGQIEASAQEKRQRKTTPKKKTTRKTRTVG